MANDGAAHEPPAEPIGRVRLDDPPVSGATGAGTSVGAEGSGWSVAGVGLALLLALVMVGAMIIILWATFQTRG
jgi:hypothetical protein